MNVISSYHPSKSDKLEEKRKVLEVIKLDHNHSVTKLGNQDLGSFNFSVNAKPVLELRFSQNFKREYR